MADQLSFASLDFAAKKKRTKRDVWRWYCYTPSSGHRLE